MKRVEVESFVSVVIAAGRKNLVPTLQSLHEQDYPKDGFEVIVVTEHEDIKLFDRLEVTLIKVQERNPSFKRNIGAQRAKGEILAFIDDDAVAPVDWLSKAVATLQSKSEYAGVGGPNLLFPNADWRQRLSDSLLNLPLIGAGNRTYGLSETMRKAKHGDIHLVNFFVYKDVFTEVNGLNESVGYGGEDTEFLYQIKEKTKKSFLYQGSLFVYHERRPFGLAYIRQRFWFRYNNGRIFLAFPSIYAKRLSFWLLLLVPMSVLIALLFHPYLLTPLLFLYAALVFVASLCCLRSPLTLLLMAATPLHHLAYVLGFYVGLLDGLLRREAVNKIVARVPIASANKN